MLPVSDLEKLDDQKIDPEASMSDMGTESATPAALAADHAATAAEQDAMLNPPSNKPGAKPGPKKKPHVNGDAGRPTLHQQKKNKDKLTIKVNRSQDTETQYDQLNKTIDALKEQGIDATLRIGFEDGKKTS